MIIILIVYFAQGISGLARLLWTVCRINENKVQQLAEKNDQLCAEEALAGDCNKCNAES
jgi:hypothetical protein